jgi:hypothetical protein
LHRSASVMKSVATQSAAHRKVVLTPKDKERIVADSRSSPLDPAGVPVSATAAPAPSGAAAAASNPAASYVSSFSAKLRGLFG